MQRKSVPPAVAGGLRLLQRELDVSRFFSATINRPLPQAVLTWIFIDVFHLTKIRLEANLNRAFFGDDGLKNGV